MNNPIDQVHDRVKVKVVLREGLPPDYSAVVYLKVFDPDHYLDGGTANTAEDGDPNDHDPDSHEANDNVGGEASGGMQPLASQVTFLAGETEKESGELTIHTDYRQPGNNFIVAAHGWPGFFSTYSFADDGVTLRYRLGGVLLSVPWYEQTPMLTVWRTLWVEQEDMVAPNPALPPTGQGPFDGAGVGNDDVYLDPGTLPIALMQSSLAAALIRVLALPPQYNVKDDTPGDNTGTIEFSHNLLFTGMQQKGNDVRDVPSTSGYWVVQVIGAYEAGKNPIVDPPDDYPDLDGEDQFIWGFNTGLLGDCPIYVFLETLRDVTANKPGTVNLATFENRAVLHEVLHQFLGAHSENPQDPSDLGADEGVMNAENARAGTAGDCELTPRQIRVIQEKFYPGQ